ncbi:MAG: EamA family transporter [Gammaproteobacteria bacterium]|nr:EamA family transporter [Gammaproteobacteria bacterium]
MEFNILLAVLLAALFHASWNASVKSSGDHLVSIAGLQLACGIIALFLIPFFDIPARESWPYLFFSALLHSGYYIALSEAYRSGDFAQAYPVARGTAPIIVALWGVFFLNEYLNPPEMLALAGIIIGIMIFATRRFGQVLQDKRAMLSALITSVFIAAYTLVDGIGGRLSENVSGYVVWLSILDMIPIVLYTMVVRSGGVIIPIARNWKRNLAGAALALGSYWVVVWAMSQASIPLVSALRETSIVIAALIGTFYFKEPSGKRRIVASIIIVCAITLLAFENH